MKANSLIVVDNIEIGKIKTKTFTDIIEALNAKNALIVTNQENKNLERSARNVPGVKVLRIDGLNVYDILKYENLVLTESSVKEIEGRLLV